MQINNHVGNIISIIAAADPNTWIFIQAAATDRQALRLHYEE